MTMIITLRDGCDERSVVRDLARRGLWTKTLKDTGRIQFLVEQHSAAVDPQEIRAIRGVQSVSVSETAFPRVLSPPRVQRLRDLRISHETGPFLFAGPCSVESSGQIEELAAMVKKQGAHALRGGAFKPRTSPYAFQGHGPKALEWLKSAADKHGLATVSEIMGTDEIEAAHDHIDIVQVGSRNMQNYSLLRAIGQMQKPVLLKRGMAATLEEWLGAAEYLLLHGASACFFCERGVRGFDPSTRNLIDLGAVALLRHVHRQVVFCDPSHAAGRRDLVVPLSRAALAAGASGLLIEVHFDPGEALSDGPQAIHPEELSRIGTETRTGGGAW